MPQLELAAGTIEYQDTGGDGPVLVFLHGLTMDGSLWRKVVPGLVPDYLCVLPTLPLGGHRIPMEPDADLSLPAWCGSSASSSRRRPARRRLVSNDWGGALLLVELGCAERVGRLVITPSEAFDNFPPGLARPHRRARRARRPPASGSPDAAARLRALSARFPLLFGWMSKRPVPARCQRPLVRIRCRATTRSAATSPSTDRRPLDGLVDRGRDRAAARSTARRSSHGRRRTG